MSSDYNIKMFKLGKILFEYDNYIKNNVNSNIKYNIEFEINDAIKGLVKYFSFDLLSSSPICNKNRIIVFKLARQIYKKQELQITYTDKT